MLKWFKTANAVKTLYSGRKTMKTDDKTVAPLNRNGALDFLKFAASVILVLHHYQQVNNVFIDNGKIGRAHV